MEVFKQRKERSNSNTTKWQLITGWLYNWTKCLELKTRHWPIYAEKCACLHTNASTILNSKVYKPRDFLTRVKWSFRCTLIWTRLLIMTYRASFFSKNKGTMKSIRRKRSLIVCSHLTSSTCPSEIINQLMWLGLAWGDRDHTKSTTFCVRTGREINTLTNLEKKTLKKNSEYLLSKEKNWD